MTKMFGLDVDILRLSDSSIHAFTKDGAIVAVSMTWTLYNGKMHCEHYIIHNEGDERIYGSQAFVDRLHKIAEVGEIEDLLKPLGNI